MHSKQVRSRWWKILIHTTVIISLRAKEKNSLKERKSGREEPGKEQAETRRDSGFERKPE